jgi:UDP-glucose 4-epimerase
MAKVTITGGSGFIENHIAKFWSLKDYSVQIIDNLRSGYEKNISGFENTTLNKISINDKEKVLKII